MDEPNLTLLAGAPTNKQAKQVFWRDFKQLIPKEWVESKSDGELWIKLINGSVIRVAGLDAPDRIEGSPLHGALVDEYGNCAERILPEVLSPMLADTGGFGWFIGVPEGRNHYYESIQAVKAGKWGDLAKVFHWPSWEILDPAIIEQERSKYDDQYYCQEFGGEFVHFSGRAYYAFDEKIHCRIVKGQVYDPRAPISFCFDFNVDPGVAVIVQERELRNGITGSACIGEVYIPKNSNTEIVTRKLCEDWKEHEGRIHLFGDHTGGSRGSAKLQGSDWDIIKRVLATTFRQNQIIDNVTTNPAVKKRINAMNSRLRSVDGTVRMMIDPKACPHLTKDLEGVTILEGSAGEIDKKSSPHLTHISDALGYYIASMFPVDGDKSPRFSNVY